MSQPSTFHESWHRVAGLRMELRPHLRMHRQHYRGERWHVIEDPLNNKFHRLRPGAWDFVSRLNGGLTVEEVWQACLEHRPEDAPGQTEAIQLLGQLHAANLLAADVPADAASLFERHSKTRQREIQSRLSSIMFLRVPLFDPDAFLRWAMPVAGRIFSRWGALLWLMVVALGLKTIVENFDLLLSSGAGVLAPSNLPMLYCAVALLAALHELGHGFTCRKQGGEVHTLGLMLLVFTPVPYVDASASWAFPKARQRILVASAGMLVEFFVASLAALVWASTGAGTLNALAYNVMIAASISTLLFNINPLLRFDGYYILCDVIGMPNLYGRAQNQIKYFFERHVFGVRQARSVATGRREAAVLYAYGVASLIYRVFLFTSIILFVSTQFLVLGVMLALYCAFGWGLLPFGKLIRYLAQNPRLERTRRRAVAATLALAIIPISLLGLLPVKKAFTAPGVVLAEEFQQVAGESAGHLVEVFKATGSRVAEGEALLRLEDATLEYELRMARAQLDEVAARRARALHEGAADIDSVAKLEKSVLARLAHLEMRQAELVVRAPAAGLWLCPDLSRSQGKWFARGDALGLILEDGVMRFHAIVDQAHNALVADAARPIRGAKIRLHGQSVATLPVANSELQTIESERRLLPSAALGWLAGGEVATSGTEERGRLAEQGFFEVRARIQPDAPVALYHGLRGRMRIELPPEPMLSQLMDGIFRLIQRTYGPDRAPVRG